MLARQYPQATLAPVKRLVAFGLVITLGFLAMGGALLLEVGRHERVQAITRVENLLAAISSELSRNIELYDLSLQAVADGLRLPGIDGLTPETRRMILFDRAATAEGLGSIFVLDRAGNVTMDSRSAIARDRNYSEREYFQFHRQNPGTARHISPPWVTEKGAHVIGISRRLNDADGSFAGVVVGTVALSYFHNLFQKFKLGDDALALVTRSGLVLMRAPFEIRAIGMDVSRTAVFLKIADADLDAGSFEETGAIDQVRRIFVYQKVSGLPLQFAFGLSVDSIYRAWWNDAWRIGSLLLALCITNMAFVLFLANALKRRAVVEYKLEKIALTDSLTGLSNRRGLDEAFAHEWRRAQRGQYPISLLMIDADHFKAYNDEFGHHAGDLALTMIAKCIMANTRRASDLGARYGGEEFAVLLPGVTVEEAFKIAEQIRIDVLALREEQQGRFDWAPTVSIGVASMIPHVGLEPRDLAKAADTVLYEAKAAGRNCCVAAVTRQVAADGIHAA